MYSFLASPAVPGRIFVAGSGERFPLFPRVQFWFSATGWKRRFNDHAMLLSTQRKAKAESNLRQRGNSLRCKLAGLVEGIRVRRTQKKCRAPGRLGLAINKKVARLRLVVLCGAPS